MSISYALFYVGLDSEKYYFRIDEKNNKFIVDVSDQEHHTFTTLDQAQQFIFNWLTTLISSILFNGKFIHCLNGDDFITAADNIDDFCFRIHNRNINKKVQYLAALNKLVFVKYQKKNFILTTEIYDKLKHIIKLVIIK